MALSAEDVKALLSDAGIPEENTQTYSDLFIANGIRQKHLISELNKDVIKDMGITLLGHQLAIISLEKKLTCKPVEKKV